MTMLYRVLHDYGSYEGMKFLTSHDGVVLEYPSVDAAVKAAIGAGYTSTWMIVQLIDWKAEQPEVQP